MPITTQKHRDFVDEPIGNKPVTTLPGIGKALGRNLEQKGFNKAYMVLGQFLLLSKDVKLFTEWLKDVGGANGYQAGMCAQCLRDWCDAFL